MNAFFTPRFRLGWILVLIGLANALFWTCFRWNYENQLVKTQITLDFEDTRTLADAYKVRQLDLLRQFQKRGASSVALYDLSLNNFRDNGRLSITPREEAERLYPSVKWVEIPSLYRYLVTSTDGGLLARLRPRLEVGTINTVRPVVLREASSRRGELPFGLLLPASKQLFSDVQLGFDPIQVNLAREAGLSITARLSNSINFTPESLKQRLQSAHDAGARVVIFSEDEVMGYQTLIAGTAREMRDQGLIFTNIEFSKQRGAEEFARNTEGFLARVHSVAGDESAKAKPEVLVDRYTRAAKERNIRVLYIRLLRQAKGEPAKPAPDAAVDTVFPLELEKSAYTQNLEFIGKISEELSSPPPFLQALPFLRPAMTMDQAAPFGNYPMDQFEASAGPRGAKFLRYCMLFFSGLGVVGATLLLLNLFFDLSAGARLRWTVAGIALVGLLSLSGGIGAKIMALQAGWTLPIIAILWGGLPLVWDGRKILEGKLTPLRVALFGTNVLLRTTFLTLIGGFLIVALLNNWRFMSKADEFLGEKATQFLPLLIVPLAFLGEVFPHRVEKEGAQAGRILGLARAKRALEKAFTARVALISVGVLAMGYLWMARFGNDSGMEISAMELKLRATLEKIFLTRPRTKEIFLGHPALLFTIFFLLRRQKLWALAALVPAIIGQADVLNTMCHIHTPVFYSLWRSVTGIFIGAFVGWIALIGWFALEGRKNKILSGKGNSL